jgi:uncharacterized membrane protein YbhN (UPF0104 family)
VSLAALVPMPWLHGWLRVAIIVVGAGAVMAVVLVLYALGQRSSDQPVQRAGLLQAAWRLFATILVETGRMQTRMRRHRRAALGFWVASLVNVGLMLTIWRLVLPDIGHDVDFQTIVLAAGCAAIATAVPVSVAGIGIYEGVTVALLDLAGVPASHALLVALVARAAFMASSFLGLPSAVMLWRDRRS